jgi:hypothetical protein
MNRYYVNNCGSILRFERCLNNGDLIFSLHHGNRWWLCESVTPEHVVKTETREIVSFALDLAIAK